MPRRNDLHKILLIGSGPIVIGQACEFDYSGTQACKALREEGYEVVLVNSNPATIMTDPGMADRTYIEPLTWEIVARVIEAERPDALLPTLGGQTGLNLAMELDRNGVLEKYGVEMIGARADVIAKAEEREQFKQAMEKIGLEVCRGRTVHSLAAAREVLKEIGLPCVIRPSFTLGGSGSNVAYNREEFDAVVSARAGCLADQRSADRGIDRRLERIRNGGDARRRRQSSSSSARSRISIRWAFTRAIRSPSPRPKRSRDKEYQRMRDASLAVIREIGVETGGSNIQFAIDPQTGRMIVIEMNPRVSRSSALASKATGFPIAKIAAKLAVGYRLHELPNDITRETMACFEPTIDYVVTKIPRFAFEKFPEADSRLTTQMKSVGETMAIGRTFKESFQKALRGLEVGSFGLGCDGKDLWDTPQQPSIDEIRAKLATPNADRALVHPLRDESRHVGRRNPRPDANRSLVSRRNASRSSQWKTNCERATSRPHASDELLRRAKQFGFSDRQLSTIWNCSEMDVPRAVARAAASWPRSNRSTPAPPNSKPTRPITIRPTKTKTKRRPSRPAAGGS